MAYATIPTASPGEVAVPNTRLINTTAPLTGGGDLSADRTLGLADTTVVPGVYTNLNATIDSKGRITAAASGSAGSAPRVVTYIATGLEGVDFTVTIGVTLAADNYEIFYGIAGAADLPILDFPNVLAGDRTTTTFRVLAAVQPTAGDIIKFLLIQ